MTLSQPPFRPVVNNNPEKERVRAASSQRAGAQVSPRGGGGRDIRIVAFNDPFAVSP